MNQPVAVPCIGNIGHFHHKKKKKKKKRKRKKNLAPSPSLAPNNFKCVKIRPNLSINMAHFCTLCMYLYPQCLLLPSGQEKKRFSHKPVRISMQTHFCRIALSAKFNFWVFLSCKEKNEKNWPQSGKKKKKDWPETLKKNPISGILHFSFSKEKNKTTKKKKKKRERETNKQTNKTHSTELFWLTFKIWKKIILVLPLIWTLHGMNSQPDYTTKYIVHLLYTAIFLINGLCIVYCSLLHCLTLVYLGWGQKSEFFCLLVTTRRLQSGTAVGYRSTTTAYCWYTAAKGHWSTPG